MKFWNILKDKQKRANLCVWVLLTLIGAVLLFGWIHGSRPVHMDVSDNIQRIDLDTIYLKNSGVEVSFSDIILSSQYETRKLIVSTQTAPVSINLTDRLIKQLDFDFLKKTQAVSYTGTGYFVVDLDNLTAENIVDDKQTRTVTILIDHPYLQSIDIDPNGILIDEVKTGLLAWGDIKLTVKDYSIIEKELRARLEEQFNTAANGQQADATALRMVKEVYEPIVRAVDSRYQVIVKFK